MNGPILLDTDVIIDHLRGHLDAVAYIGSLQVRPHTSVIVVAELYAGVRDGQERDRLVRFLSGLVVVPLSEAVAVAGGLFRRAYGKSHGVGLDDALVAATAQQQGATLVTLNAKHFPMLTAVSVPYTKP